MTDFHSLSISPCRTETRTAPKSDFRHHADASQCSIDTGGARPLRKQHTANRKFIPLDTIAVRYPLLIGCHVANDNIAFDRPLITTMCVFLTLLAAFSWLDLSFNQIRKIENIATLTELREIYFVNCKIAELEGLDSLVNLRLLEMGSNRLRTIQNLGNLTNLEELWLGRNKIATIQVRLPRLCWLCAILPFAFCTFMRVTLRCVLMSLVRELIKRPPGSRHSSQASKI